MSRVYNNNNYEVLDIDIIQGTRMMFILLGKISCSINMSNMTCRSKTASEMSRLFVFIIIILYSIIFKHLFII